MNQELLQSIRETDDIYDRLLKAYNGPCRDDFERTKNGFRHMWLCCWKEMRPMAYNAETADEIRCALATMREFRMWAVNMNLDIVAS